ncbi:hypothetical protein QR680_004379 [Steinernema hermaphroditum]|uniref:Nuclear receptor domain-containing protein n=1 Tax=Steinernema hermaphroditum TaxID=289476 RepID=A0AA39HNI2_9BILA|nr:hypothetical protein QR680_004379 [Steinernema hermaphroditum]
MPVCKACYNRCAVGKNFGAETCASCAAFFRRTVRLKIVYPCKNDFYSCRKDAVRFVSAVHACRKCRFDRCIELGMNPGLVQNPRPNQSKLSLMPKEVVHSFSTQFPLISSMTNVLRATLLDRCITSDARLTIGTSEPASNFLSYNVYRRLTLCEVKKYREMLDYSPVVCELNKDVKDAIFRNSFALALIVVQVHFNLKHRSLGFENKKKIYIFPNVYFDLDPEKLLFFFASHKNPQSLAGMNDCLAIARVFDLRLPQDWARTGED